MFLHTRSNGFTLIEVLLVMTILGLLSGMLMLTAPHNQARSLESEIRSFQALLEQASAAAVRNSEHYGIAMTAGNWQLLQFDVLQARRNSWVRIAWQDINSAHPRHRWSTDTHARLSKANDTHRRSNVGQSFAQPDLIVYANGEMSDFVIEVSSRQDKSLSYTLRSDGFNLSLMTE